MKYTKVWLFLSATLVTAAIFMASGVAWSQVNLGSVRGEVQDTQHAAIPGATLTLKNESTGVSQSANSGADGQYVFLNLVAGNYTLTTASSGFSTNVQQHVVVGIGSTVPISVTLQPGQVQQTVTVAANPAQVETQTLTSIPSFPGRDEEPARFAERRYAQPAELCGAHAWSLWFSAGQNARL
jgi:hypothetical protein